MSYVQLSEGGFQVVYPLGLWSRSSGVVIWIWLVNYLHLHLHTHVARGAAQLHHGHCSCRSALLRLETVRW